MDDSPTRLPLPRRVAGRAYRAAIMIAFFGALLLLGAIAVYAARENLAADRAREWVDHTHAVLVDTLRLERSVTLMEARHRAYLLAGEPDYLQWREESHVESIALVERVAAEIADNPEQLQRLRRARDAIDARHRQMSETSALVASAGLDAARQQFHAFGSGAFDPVQAALSVVRDGEQRLLEARRRTSDQRARQFDRVLVYGTTAGLLALLAAGWALRAQIRRSETMARTLARTSAQQQAMLDGGAAIIVSVRPDGVIRLFNRAASQALGYTAEEIIDRHTPAIFHDADEITEHAARVSAELGETVQGFAAFTARADRGLPERREWTYVRKDGSRFPVDLAISALRDAGGELIGYIGMASDLSERKAAEQSVQALNRELAAKADALVTANRELESFSYSVSHDLRAPLRHIEGYARMLQEDAEGRLEPEWQRYLDSISASARRMGTLIDDLLTFSRLSRAPLQRRRVDMAALAGDVLRELPAGPADITIGSLPQAPGDPVLLRQVLANLLANAIKYSAPRGAAARIALTGRIQDQSVVYEVQDNGVGFDMRYRDKLFGVFQRLHSQDQFEGTGVGLAIVDRIVRRHGGRVDAQAEPDRGAVFRFELPLACEEPGEV